MDMRVDVIEGKITCFRVSYMVTHKMARYTEKTHRNRTHEFILGVSIQEKKNFPFNLHPNNTQIDIILVNADYLLHTRYNKDPRACSRMLWWWMQLWMQVNHIPFAIAGIIGYYTAWNSRSHTEILVKERHTCASMNGSTEITSSSKIHIDCSITGKL